MLFSYINRIGTTYYYIVNNKFLYNWSKRSVYSSEHGDDYGLTFIKSEINYNRSLPFIWLHISDHNRIYFTTFNLTSNKMENTTYRIYDCSSEIYKTKINKITKNKLLQMRILIKRLELRFIIILIIINIIGLF